MKFSKWSVTCSTKRLSSYLYFTCFRTFLLKSTRKFTRSADALSKQAAGAKKLNLRARVFPTFQQLSSAARFLAFVVKKDKKLRYRMHAQHKQKKTPAAGSLVNFSVQNCKMNPKRKASLETKNLPLKSPRCSRQPSCEQTLPMHFICSQTWTIRRM